MSKSISFLLIFTFFVTAPLFLIQNKASAHCQIPCGIYDDYAKFQEMVVDAVDVDRAVKNIQELAGKTDPQSQNQLIRWVTNKEQFSQHIITTISDYYLTQRVNPSQKDYIERLTKHHAVIIAAMKAKQNADLAHVTQLMESIEELRPYYPEHSE